MSYTDDIFGGSSEDAIRALGNTAYNRSNELFGQSTGLSPQALSALRTQSTSGISDQYESAAKALSTGLLRRGAVGQGALPSSGGDISRAFQPLYSSMEAAKTKAERDTILADDTARRDSLDRNNALSVAALNSAGGFANTLADIEPASMRNLLLTSLLSGAVSGGGALGGLMRGGGTNGSGNFGVIGDLLGGLGGGSEGGFNVGWNPREVIGEGASGAAGAVGGGGIGGALSSAGGAIGSALGTVGHAATALLTNPITAVAGAALVGVTAWLKSQAHWEANTWVNGEGGQVQFDQNMRQLQDGVQRSGGQMPPEQYAQVRQTAQQAIQKYLQKLDTFYREKGTNSDQGRVAAQAYQTFIRSYGADGSGYLSQLDRFAGQA